MKRLFLVLVVCAIHGIETEIEESARKRAEKYKKFVAIMNELENARYESELMYRRKFKVDKLRKIIREEQDEDSWLILSACDFDN